MWPDGFFVTIKHLHIISITENKKRREKQTGKNRVRGREAAKACPFTHALSSKLFFSD
jgi:hypothetical protein